jgi:hypothetical protein
VEGAALINKQVYCSFFINSKSHGTLPKGLFLAKIESKIDFVDHLSSEKVAWRREVVAKMAAGGVSIRREPEIRYWWDFSSKRVPGEDLEEHVLWLLSNIRSGKFLKNELSCNYDFYLSVFWGASNGTGGGPVISPKLAQKLVEHGIRMEIRFYVK